MEEIWTIDFEASGLNLTDSYPIQVGYTNGTFEREMEIYPHESWEHWDPAAQEVHGMSRADLRKVGRPGPEVCKIMNNDLRGKVVYCDGGIYDQHWCFRLFDTAKVEREFRLVPFIPIGMNKNRAAHRALADAKQLWRFIEHENMQWEMDQIFKEKLKDKL